MMINARTSALRPGASRPSGARARPALAVVVRNNPVEKAAATSQAEANGVQEAGKDLVRKLLDEQEDAAKSGNEVNKLMQWASDLGSKAQQALAGLQRSISQVPAEAAEAAEAAAKTSASAESDIAATITKLEGVSAAIRDSNVAFDKAFAANGTAAAEAAAAVAADAEAAVASRQAYLQDLANDMEAAETRLKEEAEAAAQTTAAAAKEAAEAAETAAKEVAEAAAEPLAAAAAVVAAAVDGKAGAAEPAGTVQVNLAVHRETSPGQDVWLVGSAPALGEWDLDQALALAWTDGHVWRATIDVDLSAATHIEYKAVLKCADGAVIWEGGDNKVADLAAGPAVELMTEFTD